MEDTLKDLKRELERKIEKYKNRMGWIKNELEKLTPEKDLNSYYSLSMNLSELATLAAEIQMVQDHISMVETYN